ncbi:MAG: hypothetical protein JO328_07230 [Hyphomicrobiales bacterium]|nr:hypothetical protein [Hyphomicrobiales bacterium]MBV8824257.1 hypothetical protein [Hyphomicrobiales bacterium]MBV9428587.1 hypothetical protein [Bradyrhizobiaceae bacterium]
MQRTVLINVAAAVNMFSQSYVLAGLSPALFEKYQSALLASSAYATIWVPALCVIPIAPWYSSRFDPARLYIGGELLGAVMLALAAVLFDAHTVVSGGALILRGFFSTVTYTSATLYIKGGARPEKAKSELGYFETSRLVGSMLAAIFGWFTFDSLSFAQVCLVGAAMTLLGTGIAAAWPRNPPLREVAAGPIGRREDGPRGGSSFVPLFALLLSTVPLLSFHHAAKTPLAMDYLHLGASGVATVILVNTVAVAVGAWFASFTVVKIKHLHRASYVLLNALSAIFMIATPSISNILVCLLFYGLYLFVYQISVTSINVTMVAEASMEQAALIVPLKAALWPAALLVFTLGLGLLADTGDLNVTAQVAAAASVISGVLILFVTGSMKSRLARRWLPGRRPPPSRGEVHTSAIQRDERPV